MNKITVRLPAPLARQLGAHAKRANLPTSATVRDLLRHALGTVKTPRDAGWHEGYSAGYADVQKRLARRG